MSAVDAFLLTVGSTLSSAPAEDLPWVTEASPCANANKAVNGVIGHMQLINVSEQDRVLKFLSKWCRLRMFDLLLFFILCDEPHI